MKKICALLLAFILIIALAGCKNQKNKEKKTIKEEKTEIVKDYNIVIKIKDYGTIEATLDGKAAPITVKNFVSLINEKFYDGLTFHRIIKGFMIQGGDPMGNGTGGSDNNIKGEFKANGYNNPISHQRGVLSMARSQDYNSASSQFFIMQKDNTSLDGQYAAFGKVTKGIEIVDKICDNVKVEDNNGTVKDKNQPIITSIRIK
ncbi:peptidylprolyl isomerase [Eggerthia catenaformis]|uniref:peptidylprolyl isomerase n=1 Tax=Eggerthia catenaformis TaxID=31973 RepID=UPI0028E4CE27|nr:peptidylprolyl isomerase [Eggerthia catenaformis]